MVSSLQKRSRIFNLDLQVDLGLLKAARLARLNIYQWNVQKRVMTREAGMSSINVLDDGWMC